MMTTVLRDSLGGNTRTVMIATVTAAAGAAEESMATCRFAQRVALVKNKVSDGLVRILDLIVLHAEIGSDTRLLCQPAARHA